MNPVFPNHQIIIPRSNFIVLKENSSTLNDNDLYKAIEKYHNYFLYGNSLLEMLAQESQIKFNNDGESILSRIFTGDANADATRLIGSIAESLVVDYCNKYTEINRRLGMYARNGNKISKSLDDFIAIATGSNKTRDKYYQHYSPSDTQRDIIWIDKNNMENTLLCIAETKAISGKMAGIQIKASYDYRYVLHDIGKYHYPVLYFDLNNDWWQLSEALKRKGDNTTILIPHDKITCQIKDELIGYYNILVKVFREEITLKYLIDFCKYNGMIVMEKGIKSAELSNDNKIIIPSG